MEEFPNNSLDPKIQRPVPTGKADSGDKKVIQKIVTDGSTVRRKKTLIERVTGAFVVEGKTIGQSIVQDILIPAFKDTISDAIINGVERAVHGEVRSTTRRTNHRGPVGNSSNISYNRYAADNRRHEPERPIANRGRGGHHFDEIELRSRAEGQAILRQMDEIVKRYGHVSVSDLYEMVSLDAEFTDERWGWTDLFGSDVRRLRSGNYALILPPTEAIG